MSRGPGRWQRAALALLQNGDELIFGQIAAAVGALTWSNRVALRRALDRLVATGHLGKRVGQANVWRSARYRVVSHRQ